MSKTRVLNNKLPIDTCNRVCEYEKCHRCMKKIKTMEDFDDHFLWSKGNNLPNLFLVFLMYRYCIVIFQC